LNPGMVIRDARAGDGAGCARAWSDAGRYITTIDPVIGQVPEAAGLAEWFEAACASARGPEELWFVAECDGEVVGFVQAVIDPPTAYPHWQLQRDLASSRLVIDSLAVVEEQRRSGVGTELMTAVEHAGRSRGAAVATLDTNLRSFLSMPFYEDRMGYQRHAVIFRKQL
jgi:GNAT superfamily N-acetyltransferase